MSRRDEHDPLGERLWAAETAPLPRVTEFDAPLPLEGGPARAVVMHLQSAADIARVFNRDATIFVLMPDPPMEGTAVECVLVHPVDHHREVKVMAEVIRVGETLAGTGVELRFEPPGAALREALLAFVRPA